MSKRVSRAVMLVTVVASAGVRSGAAGAGSPDSNPPPVTHVAQDVDLIRGRFVPNTQPDGNSVLFRGPKGLVVVDTGRHPEHTQAILDFAAKASLPIAAVVNTHWHLDHVGGNPLVRRAHPGVRVYASGAIAGALLLVERSYRVES